MNLLILRHLSMLVRSTGVVHVGAYWSGDQSLAIYAPGASYEHHHLHIARAFEQLTNTIIDYRPHSSLAPLEVLHRFSFSLQRSS